MPPAKPLRLLQAGELEEAKGAASTILATNPSNATAAAVRGLSTWVVTGETLLRELLRSGDDSQPNFNVPGMIKQVRAAFAEALKSLYLVRKDFATAANDPTLSLPICLACWERDWNKSGEVDDRDRRLLAIQFDRNGQRLEEGDPRAKPTYGFDVGDAHWAHAMASFQASAIEIAFAYDDEFLAPLLQGIGKTIAVRLVDKDGITRGRDLILAGLDSSDAARRSYLAETDDNVEWVPSPAQTNYPMPLEVDAALYETWSGIIGDVRDLVAGKTAISLAELGALSPEISALATTPSGFLDIGRMLREPRSIRISMEKLAEFGAQSDVGMLDADAVYTEIFGIYYQADMKPSPITKRLLGLSEALQTGGDTLERKLMYLLWLN